METEKENVKSRLIQFMNYKGLKTRTFEKLCGMSNGYLKQLRHSPKDDKIADILKVFPELNEIWLRSGVGEMIVGGSDEISSATPYIKEKLVNVPYVPYGAVASFVENLYGTEYDMEEYGVLQEEGEDLFEGGYMVFHVEGDSMFPTIIPGAKILCKRIEENKWEYADGIVVIVYGKTLTVKRIVNNRIYTDNTLTICGDNPRIGSIDVARSEIRAMWKAIRIVSQKLI